MPIIKMKNYTANKTTSLPDWNHAERLTDFCSPWTGEPVPPMVFMALWNQEKFIFRFEVADTGIRVYEETNHKMEVVHSDRVEIFFRSDERMDPYFCLEMDPSGRVLDYRTRYYRRFEYEWQWPGKDDISVKAEFNSTGYSVEGAISLQSLRELELLRDGILEAGLFRGKCLTPAPDASFNWISWVRPDSEQPDFHIPSAFGRIKLI